MNIGIDKDTGSSGAFDGNIGAINGGADGENNSISGGQAFNGTGNGIDNGAGESPDSDAEIADETGGARESHGGDTGTAAKEGASPYSDKNVRPALGSEAYTQQGTPAPAVNYPQRLANEIIAKSLPTKRTADDAERILTAYEYIICHTFFAPPVGTEIWRVRGGETPSYTEARAISPLLYGVGSCEDFAAATALLLCRMGYEAEYLAGLTISAKGGFTDHAWVIVKLSGIWYHLDPQLEQNVMKNSTITYRYFLKSDEYMLADHRWGQNLLDYGVLSDEQNEEIKASFMAHPCPLMYRQSFTPKPLSLPMRPDTAAIESDIAREIRGYEEKNGKLPQSPLDITPPVFGYESYRES